MAASTKIASKVKRRVTTLPFPLIAIILSVVTTFTGIQLFHGTTTSSFVAAAAETVPSKGVGRVITLDTKNFDSSMSDGKVWLIEFYAPWCGHCKALEPEWNDAASQLKGKVKLAKVDADSEKALGKRFGVTGFPTIKYFDYGLPKSASSAKDY